MDTLPQREVKQRKIRPSGVTLVAFFFGFGALASGVAALLLLLPGTPLDVLWRINPRGHEAFMLMGRWSVLLMVSICVLCGATALGLWRSRRWAYWTAISLLIINFLGDTINAFLHDRRALIGLPIAALMIAYLASRRNIFVS